MRTLVSRFSVAVPLIAVAVLLARGTLFSLSPVAIAVQVGAAALAIWARRSFRAGQFRVVAEPGHGGLIRTGPFRFVRHPMYTAALAFVWAGIAARGSLVDVLVGVAVVLVLVLRIPLEERLVRASYPEYDDYARSTRRLVPFVY